MLLDILICLIITHIFQFLTPFWWWIMVIPFLYCLVIPKSPVKSFFIGAIAGSFLWLIYGLYLETGSSQIIAGRISGMMGLNSYILLIITFAIAFFAAGFSSLSGSVLSRTFRGKRSK